MPEYNIKISELDEIKPNPPFTEDFFPLVHSASMTTYRATIQDIGSLITHSIYADTCSLADSASYAISSSHAISASHALLADSSSYYPPQFQDSCSWASRSLHAELANNSNNVYFSGSKGYYPYWGDDLGGTIHPDGYVEGGANGNLCFNPNLIQLFQGPVPSLWSGEVVFINSGSSTLMDHYPFDVPGSIRRNVTESIYNPMANQRDYTWGAYGINTFFPIISDTFVGTDQMTYTWTHTWPPRSFYCSQSFTNSYWSGSTGDTTSGSWQAFNSSLGYSLKNVLNDHWVRIVSCGRNGGWTSTNGLKPVSDHAAMGERSGGGTGGIEGIIRIHIGTADTNMNHVVYMILSNFTIAGYMTAQVIQSSAYSNQVIKEIRMYQGMEGGIDPPLSLDIKLGNLSNGDDIITIECQSWGGVNFLKYPNVDPWPPVITGSNDITLSPNVLIIPAAPGYYTNLPKRQNYYIQGQNVVIWPTFNEITQSGIWNSVNESFYSLNVSGGIQTNTKYYCDDHAGLTTKITYRTADLGNGTYGTANLYFSGGILIDKYPPDVYVPPVLPTTVDVCVIGICNSNSILDDKFSVFLNSNFIGYYDGGANTLRNSLFLGNMTDAITQASQDTVNVSCKSSIALANRMTYRFSPLFVVAGQNTLVMTNIETHGSGNVGAIKVLKYSLNISTGVLSEVSTLLTTTYSGTTGMSFTKTFTW